MTDKLEKVTGIDIDGDGDVGMPGHDNKAGALRAVGSKGEQKPNTCICSFKMSSDVDECIRPIGGVGLAQDSVSIFSITCCAISAFIGYQLTVFTSMAAFTRKIAPESRRHLATERIVFARRLLEPQKGFDDGTRRPRGHDGLYGAPASVIRKHVRANIELHRERNKTAHWKHAMSASAANEVDEFQSASSFWLWPTRFAEWLGPKSRGIVGWREEPRNLDNRAQFRQYIGLDRIDRHKQAVEDQKRDKQKRQRCEACLERIKAIALQLLLAIAIVAPLAWLSMWWWSSYIDPKPPTPPMPPMPPTPPPSPPSPPSSLMLLEHALERMPAWLWVCGITFSGGFIAVIRTCGHQEATEFGRNQQRRPSSSSRYARLRDSPGRSPISA